MQMRMHMAANEADLVEDAASEACSATFDIGRYPDNFKCEQCVRGDEHMQTARMALGSCHTPDIFGT